MSATVQVPAIGDVQVTMTLPYWYEVTRDGSAIGVTHSHPRCLPRSWQVRLPGSTDTERESFRTRKQAVAWLAALSLACEGCNAEPGERCRWGCLSHASTNRFDPYR